MPFWKRKTTDGPVAETAAATLGAPATAPGPHARGSATDMSMKPGDHDDADSGPDDRTLGGDIAPVPTTATEDIEYPSGIKLALLLGSVFISIFLVALDRLIIATAIPKITDDFHSIGDIGWYGSAYLLATCAFQLLFGKIYTFYSVKASFLVAVGLFEIGSAICGAAPNSIAFIIGRAIAGSGAAGIFSGAIVVIIYAVPLHKRPLYQGLFGAVFGLASVIGPLLGGAFTSNVTWRWCFYINLPFGGVAMAFIFFLLKIPDRPTTKLPSRQKLAQLDAAGTSVFIPGSVCLLLALQWGGATYAWNNGRIIALLTLAFVLLIAFCLIQIFMPKTATVPTRFFKQRSIVAGVWSTFVMGSAMMIFVYFLPIWFQAIQGVSAVDSGIRTLPLVLGMVVTSAGQGPLISKVGYYTPFMIFGTCLMSIGAGLLTTLEVDTPSHRWIGYQLLYGLGLGGTFQSPNLAAQTVLPRIDVPIGAALMFFFQLLGGAVFLSVGQNVLNNELIARLASVPGLDAAFLLGSGATTLTNLPEEVRPVVLSAYNEALRKVFVVGAALACLTIIGACSMEWRSVRQNLEKKKGSDGEEGEVQADKQGHSEGVAAAGFDEKPKSGKDSVPNTPTAAANSEAEREKEKETAV